MDTDEVERKRTAFHEAGHALIGLLHGRLPVSATIRRVDDMAGKVTFEDDVPDAARSYFGNTSAKQKYLLMRVQIAVAGSAAHDLLEPDRTRDAGDAYDDAEALRLLDTWPVQDHERLQIIQEQRAEVREKLAHHREILNQIADTLFQREELAREDLVAIYEARDVTAS